MPGGHLQPIGNTKRKEAPQTAWNVRHLRWEASGANNNEHHPHPHHRFAFVLVCFDLLVLEGKRDSESESESESEPESEEEDDEEDEDDDDGDATRRLDDEDALVDERFFGLFLAETLSEPLSLSLSSLLLRASARFVFVPVFPVCCFRCCAIRANCARPSSSSSSSSSSSLVGSGWKVGEVRG